MGPGPLDYACAKAGGVLARSFVGPALVALAASPSLAEAAKLLFPGEVAPALPDRDYAASLRARFAARALADVIRLLETVETPSGLLVEAVRGAEVEYLRECVAAGDAGRAPPLPPDLGRFSTIDPSRHPDVAAMFARSAHARSLAARAGGDASDFDAALYARRHEALLAAARARPEGGVARRLVEAEARLRNAAWALRLRARRGYGPDEAAPLLAGGPAEKGAAMESFAFPLDSREAWAPWRFAPLLGEGRVEPLAFERAVAARMRALEARAFRATPLGEDRIYALVRIKERETAAVGSILEGILLGVSAERMLHLIGVDG